MENSHFVAPFLFAIFKIIEIYFDTTGTIIACQQNSDDMDSTVEAK
jgi:hypothetical protein